MRHLLTIAAFFGLMAFMLRPEKKPYWSAVFPIGSWKLHHSYVSQGEYRTAAYDSATHQGMYLFGVIPTAFTNQPAYVQEVWGGAHDCMEIDTLGNLYVDGSNEFGQDGRHSTTGTPSGEMDAVTTDSAGNPLPPIRQVCMSGNNGGTYLCNFLLSTVASGGYVLAAGALQSGMRGNGTSGATAQNSFVYVPMPGGSADTVTKIAGIYGIIAITTKDSIIGWGYNFGNLAAYVHLPHGWKAYDVSGNGIAYWALADSSGTKGVFSWSPIFSAEPAYQGQGSGGTNHTTPTRVDKNNFVKGMMAGGDYPISVNCNNEITCFVTAGHKLWTIGGNSTGDIGNGKQINFATYPTPYAWDQGLNENNQDTIYNVGPGITDWDTVRMSYSNCWTTSASRLNGSLYEWGRNKGSQIANGEIDCDWVNGNVRATYPDFLNAPWADSIFVWPTHIQQTFCPYCILNPGGFPCNLCTYNGAAAPTANPGSNIVTTSSSVYMNGSGTAASTYYINPSQTVWSQVSGPVAATIQFPGVFHTLIYGMTATGTYVFQLKVGDNNQRTATATMTVTVGCNGCLPGLTQQVILHALNTRHEKSSLIGRARSFDFRRRSESVLADNVQRRPLPAGRYGDARRPTDGE